METKSPRETDNPEELLDLVDEHDNVIGTASREKIYAEGLRNYRVVHAFIVNSAEKYGFREESLAKNSTRMDLITVPQDTWSLVKHMKRV